MHKGAITLTSKPSSEGSDGYTEFKVALLKGSAHFNTNEIAPSGSLKYSNGLDLNSLSEMQVSLDIGNETVASAKQQTILVVEDNEELREFIMQSLQSRYNVVGCINGAEGLAYAVENIPDMIISDVTMPVMDGYEFCAKIKQEERTNHIPIIMLTAMASHVHQVDGLEAGADLYITKPFSLQILELSIKNILSAKEALRSKFSRQVMLMPRSIEIQSPEESFINKLMEIVEGKLEDPDFNVSVLVNEIGMSQTVLYKKIKALTDLSINDFIKSIRLKRAAQLLQDGKLNVSEVAYSVGFNDRKYFSKEFKKQFGKAPSEYVNEDV